jgi:hypothetical protein
VSKTDETRALKPGITFSLVIQGVVLGLVAYWGHIGTAALLLVAMVVLFVTEFVDFDTVV